MTKKLTTKQEQIFSSIKQKKSDGGQLSNWELTFVKENGLSEELEKTPQGTARALNVNNGKPEGELPQSNCDLCLGEGRFTFERLTDDFQIIRGVTLNVKNARYSFCCPKCNGDDAFSVCYPKWHQKAGERQPLRQVNEALINSSNWELLVDSSTGDAQLKKLKRFFFEN